MFAARRRHRSEIIRKARGSEQVDLVVKGGRVFIPTTREWLQADIAIDSGIVVGWGARPARQTLEVEGSWITPGFIDAHMHIESTKLWIPQFVEAVLPQGTIAVANDPHEMANVAGIEGVAAMIRAARDLPFTFGFSASSCVPASGFESPGAVFDAEEMREVLDGPEGIGVAEVMNYPGVIAGNPAILAKIALAGNLRVDGHAPGVTGFDLDAYLCAGIESDHEITTLEELTEKRRKGMWVFLRQGSASQNIAALAQSVREHGTTRVALCSDDREPDLLLSRGHVNDCIRVAVESGVALEDALVMATLNAADYHGFAHLGTLSPGYQADLCIFDDLAALAPRLVLQRGTVVASDGKLAITLPARPAPSGLKRSVRLRSSVDESDFEVRMNASEQVKVIGVAAGSIWTTAKTASYRESDPALNLIAVIERHHRTGRRSVAFVEGFGLLAGAIASTVAHDAHNLMIVGANTPQGRRDMATAANHLERIGGGQAVCLDGEILAEVPLPIAGLMSELAPEVVASQVKAAQQAAAGALSCALSAPFMTLSFLGLSVIPELKLTDRGLIDVTSFRTTELLAEAPPPSR